jgi:hypothetical protein
METNYEQDNGPIQEKEQKGIECLLYGRVSEAGQHGGCDEGVAG